jgi:hypothetical protein
MKRTFMLSACLVVLALATATCSDDFTPYNRLEGLRVLAIQSEPVSPAFGQTTTLTPLVFAQQGEVVSYAWSWCPLAGPAAQDAPCLVDEKQIAGILGTSVPKYDLGTGPTATFTNNIPNEWLARLCPQRSGFAPGRAPGGSDAGVADAGADLALPDAGFEVDAGALQDAAAAPTLGGNAQVPAGLVFDCSNGFPIQIKMVATSKKDGVVTDTVTTTRKLDLSYDPAALPNTNPVIAGLTAQLLKRDEDRVKDVEGDQPEGDAAPLTEVASSTAIRQRKMRLNVVVPVQSAEPAIDRDEMDQQFASTERLFLSWFVDSGDVDDGRTGFILGKTPIEKALKNIWRPSSLKKFPGLQSKVVVVVRDSRGGVSWTWGTANLMEGPL